MISRLPEILANGLSPREQAEFLRHLGRVKSDPVAAAIALRGWTPFPGQGQVLRDLDVREGRVKLACICCGTGWGKTDLIAELHSEAAESRPAMKCLAASRSQDQANLVVKRLIASWMDHPVASRMVDHVQLSPYPTIYLKNRSYITARTTKDECRALRGPEWDFITFDEAAFGDEFAWHFLTTRVRKSNGPVFCFSSPEEDWFEALWHEFDDAREDGNETLYAYHAPATENPHLSPEYFARMKERLPDILYRREVLAEFVGSNTNTFKKEHLKRIFDDSLAPSVPAVRGHRYGLGWDLAIDSAAAVGIALDCTSPETVFGAHMETWRNTSWPHVQRRVEETTRAYRGRKAIDWTGVGKAAGQNLRVHVRPEEQFVFSGPTRYELCVEAMKFVETMADLERPIVSLLLPTAGPWGELRGQMRRHKLSLAKKKDSKSLKDKSSTWDELDAFLLAVHATKMSIARRGSRIE